MIKYFKISLLLGFFLWLSSCGGSDSGSGSEGNGSGTTDGFDRTAMLTHWIDHFFIPYTQDFTQTTETLEEKIKIFTETPNADNLNAARAALNKTYEAYQYIGFYRFGKAEDINFQYRLNTYPTNVENIKQNAIAKDYEFRKLSKISGGQIAQGLPAIDYLINGFGNSDEAIISHFTNDANAPAYHAYIQALSKEILKSSTEVLSDLKATRTQFINNTGSSASGSISLVVNAYVQYYEKNLRAGKIGYPSGILTPMYMQQSETPKPELVESQFSPQYNRSYALLGTQAMQNFFQGKGKDDAQGPSLQQYIDYMSNKINQNKTLAKDINTQFDYAKTAIGALKPNFKEQIATDINPMKTAYGQLQNNIPKLKVDMAQVLNITISYMDTDGD